MAKKTKKEIAQEFWDARPEWKAAMEAMPEDKRDAFQEEFGEAIMRKADYSRAMDEKDREMAAARAVLEEKHRGLDEWWKKTGAPLVSINEKLAAELEQAKAATAGNGGDAAASIAALKLDQFAKREDISKVVQERISASEAAGIEVMTILGSFIARHEHEFHEPLDVKAVMAKAQQRGNIETAYNEIYADKIKDKQKADEAAHEKELEAKVMARLVKERGMLPYPSPIDEAPVLAGLTASKEAKAEYGTKAALDEYYKMNRPS